MTTVFTTLFATTNMLQIPPILTAKIPVDSYPHPSTQRISKCINRGTSNQKELRSYEYVHSNCRLTTTIQGVCSSSEGSWMMQNLFGIGHWVVNWIDDLCRIDPLFLLHMREQASAYIHYLCLIRLAWRQADEEPMIIEQARLLRQKQQRSLLNELYTPYPTGLLKVISKLDDRPLSKGDYRRLLKALEHPASRLFLAHASTIKTYHLQWLQDFPHEYFHWHILNTIEQASNYQQLRFMAEATAKFPESNLSTQQRYSLKQLKTFDQLRHWFQRQLLKITFPPPPWCGNESIQPVTTMKALKQAAYRFQNCIFEYGRAVMAGQRYFYVSDKGPAVISLIKDPLIGWRIEEINGINNVSLGEDSITSITDHFAEAELHQHPISFDTSIDDGLWESVCDELLY